MPSEIDLLRGIANGNSLLKGSMAPTTICFINQKGGCGKSSSCLHLAGGFAKRGHNVLLIDVDPQGSLSQGFFGPAIVEQLPASQTVSAIFDDAAIDGMSVSDVIAPTAFNGISVVRANQTLAAHNAPIPENSGMKQFALQLFVSELTGFDTVLIDCPPNLYQCSWNALLASNFVVVPVTPEDFAAQGLRTIHQAIQNATLLNDELQLLGHLVTRSDPRLLIHRTYEAKLRGLHGELVLQTIVPEATAFKVAISCRQPVSLFAKASKAAQAIDQLVDEILQRIHSSHQHRGVA